GGRELDHVVEQQVPLVESAIRPGKRDRTATVLLEEFGRAVVLLAGRGRGFASPHRRVLSLCGKEVPTSDCPRMGRQFSCYGRAWASPAFVPGLAPACRRRPARR